MTLRSSRSRSVPAAILSILLVACCLTAAVRAQDGLTLEPKFVLRDVARAYSDGAAQQRLTITARAGVDEIRDEVVFRTAPDRGAQLEMDDLIVWCNADGVYLANRKNPDSYLRYQPGKGETTLDRLRTVLPPIPVPQIAFALRGEEAIAAPTPYTQGVSWGQAVVEESAREGRRVHVAGVTDDGWAIDIDVDPETSLIRSFTATRGAGEREARYLRVEAEPIPAGQHEDVGLNLDLRERVNSTGALRPRSSGAVTGERMPLMMLNPASVLLDGAGGDQPIVFGEFEHPPPGVYVLFREWGPKAAFGAEIARRYTADSALKPVLAATLDLAGQTSAVDRLRAMYESVDDVPLYYSLAQERTIDLIEPESDAIIVRTDADGVIQALVPIRGSVGDLSPERRDQLMGTLLRKIRHPPR